MNELKRLRDTLAGKLKGLEAENEIKSDLKELFGNDIEFTKFEYSDNIDTEINKIKNREIGRIGYTIEIVKKLNIPVEKGKTKEIKKEYQINLEYEISIKGTAITFYNKTFYGTPNYDIYGNVIDYSYNIINETADAVIILDASSNIKKFEIRKL